MRLKTLFATALLLAASTLWADAVWIDVRSQAEFDAGHINGALLMPHTEIGSLIEQAVPDKTTEIHLYCRSGRRAEAALQTLKALGYVRLINEGGFEQAQRVAACQAPAAGGVAPHC